MDYKISEIVKSPLGANFTHYHDGNLWYVIRYKQEGCERGKLEEFRFPVPIEDIGNATFMAVDKAILFMRYVRKQIEVLKNE